MEFLYNREKNTTHHRDNNNLNCYIVYDLLIISTKPTPTVSTNLYFF